jgi:hypothetical protein
MKFRRQSVVGLTSTRTEGQGTFYISSRDFCALLCPSGEVEPPSHQDPDSFTECGDYTQAMLRMRI